MVSFNGITAAISDAGKLSVAAGSTASGSLPLTITAASDAAASVKANADTTVLCAQEVHVDSNDQVQEYYDNDFYDDILLKTRTPVDVYEGDKIIVSFTPKASVEASQYISTHAYDWSENVAGSYDLGNSNDSGTPWTANKRYHAEINIEVFGHFNAAVIMCTPGKKLPNIKNPTFEIVHGGGR